MKVSAMSAVFVAAVGASTAARGEGRVDWCATDTMQTKASPIAGVGTCPLQGECDIPSVRDSWIPDGSKPPILIRMKFNVFANDDGSDPVATQAEVDAQLAHLNEDFAPFGFQFTGETEFINSTEYRFFSPGEEVAMKTQYADAPHAKLNVFVVVNSAGWSKGTFPWNPIALTALGGIIMADGHFGPNMSIMAHETGHNLGLWHTHHGVSEVSPCSACYETADGTNGDTTGDYAADTAATPVNVTCSGPGGVDGCSGVAWGDTVWQNYMGYAPQDCYTEFSPQQSGRIHCWFDTVLSSWNADCNGNDVIDVKEIADGTGEDCNDDGVLDECQGDFDLDGIYDPCDPDIDNDGVLNEVDVCIYTPVGVVVDPDGSPRSDGDDDCDVDIEDYRFFHTCMSGSGPGVPASPSVCLDWFDYDRDTDLDLRDYHEILGSFTGPLNDGP